MNVTIILGGVALLLLGGLLGVYLLLRMKVHVRADVIYRLLLLGACVLVMISGLILISRGGLHG